MPPPRQTWETLRELWLATRAERARRDAETDAATAAADAAADAVNPHQGDAERAAEEN